MDYKNKKMVFLGDSITEGHGVTDKNNIYWKRFEKDGCSVFGYGIGGTRIARQQISQNTISDKFFRSRVESMEKDADVVVVFGGTNDYGHGDAALGSMTDRTDNTFYGALHNLYTDLIEKYPTSQIIIMTPCHRLAENRVYNEMNIRNVGTLQTYVNIIKEVACFYSLPVLDLYKNCLLQPEVEINRKAYMPDGLHPNDAGHEKIYNLLCGFLKTL